MTKVIFMLCLFTASAMGQLKASSDNTYFSKQDGTPVFLNGIASWDFMTNITYTDVGKFLDSCVSHKVNYICSRIIVPSCCGVYGDGTTHENIYGVQPWTGTQSFTNGTRTEAYWLHVDSCVDLAASKGIYILMYADYLGGDPSQGWSAETGTASLTQMYQWGQFLGARYKDKTNLMWALGGDTPPATWQAKLDTLVDGMKQAGCTNHLYSTRDESGTSIDDHWNTSTYPWITMNYAYSYSEFGWYDFARTIRGRNPTMVCDLRETYYENESPLGSTTTQLQLRRAMYQFVLHGFPAQMMGNCPLWSFDGSYPYASCNGLSWVDNLNTQGWKNLKHIGNLIRNRRFWVMSPDTSNVVLTSGYSSGSDRAVAAYTRDSTCIIVYTPFSTTLTVTSAKLRSQPGDSTYAWWYDVDTGTPTWIGNYTNASHTYASGKERVLVLDAKYMSYPAPGLDTTAGETTTRHLRVQRR
jgi:hypothetical protein